MAQSITALANGLNLFFGREESSSHDLASLIHNFACSLIDSFILSQGNEAFAKKDFKTAIEFYSKAILQEPSNHIFFSNRR